MNTQITVIKSNVEVFEENDCGYQKQIEMTVLFDNKTYSLVYQAQEPEYLSQQYLEREQNGCTTGSYSLDRRTGDDSDALANALVTSRGIDKSSDDFDEATSIAFDEINTETLETVRSLAA